MNGEDLAVVVRRELGLDPAATDIEVKAKIVAMWNAIATARYLVQWWDYPGMARVLQHSLIDAQEQRLREALEALDPRSAQAKPSK